MDHIDIFRAIHCSFKTHSVTLDWVRRCFLFLLSVLFKANSFVMHCFSECDWALIILFWLAGTWLVWSCHWKYCLIYLCCILPSYGWQLHPPLNLCLWHDVKTQLLAYTVDWVLEIPLSPCVENVDCGPFVPELQRKLTLSTLI